MLAFLLSGLRSTPFKRMKCTLHVRFSRRYPSSIASDVSSEVYGTNHLLPNAVSSLDLSLELI
jgi:hypothetical protein